MGLESFFRPKSVVLVGATDKSEWSRLIHANFAKMGYEGKVFLVNRGGTPAHGQAAVTSCGDLPSRPNLAYVFVPTDAVPAALADLAASGVGNALILSSGYAETGADGAAAQAAMVDGARAGGMRLLGPNSLGFINYTDVTPVSPFPVEAGWFRGHLAIVSQSGATSPASTPITRTSGKRC